MSTKVKKGKGSLGKYNLERNITIIAFLVIPLLLLGLFTYLPLVDMFKYSFTKWDGYTDPEFIGIDNYVTIFTDPTYFTVFQSSAYYFIASLLQMGIALFFSTVFFFGMKGKNLFKGVLFFPYLLNGVAIGFMFLYFFKEGGVLDTVLLAFGVAQENIPLWLGNPAIVNISLASVSIWRYMGMNMIMFNGATQSIGSEYLEASSLDGANRWQQFRHIILPNIKTIISLNMILAIKGAISVYEIPYVMTKGTGGSMTFVIKTLETAFTSKKIGLACAMGVVLLVIVMVVTIVQKKFVEGKDE